MLMWLLKWRQTVWITLLVGLVWGSGLMSVAPVGGRVRLAGWWVGLEQQSGYGQWHTEWVKRPALGSGWWGQGWAWAESSLWLGVMVGLGGYMWGVGETWWSWGLLTLASHQVRTGLNRGAIMRGWAARAEDTGSAAELTGLMVLARLASEPPRAETELSGPSPVEIAAESPAEVMGQSLARLVERLPIGTNRGLMLFLWMLVSGQLLSSRGAIFPALQQSGLSAAESRRVWAAFAEGKWQISELLAQWQQQVEAEGVWVEHRLGGYRLKVIDLTGFWRPTLKNCPSTHFKAEAGKALPAIVLGLVTRVGQVGQQRLPLPCHFLRVDPNDPSEASLVTQVLTQVAATLAEDELVVLDAGFALKELLAVGMARFLLRLARNATARRNYRPDYQGRGRPPEKGEIVRPLARTYHGHTLEATPPDRQESWSVEHKGRQLTLTAQFWDNLVLSEAKPGADSFNIVAIHDPRYKKPLLLATPLHLDGATLKALYADRWPVEQLPLCAKQMIGAARQFVHADESVQRLPELALLAGAILAYVAAKLPPIPTGFWDRAPKSTPGRLRRLLMGRPFPANLPLPARIRLKVSLTDHLPKGIWAHRRQKRPD